MNILVLDTFLPAQQHFSLVKEKEKRSLLKGKANSKWSTTRAFLSILLEPGSLGDTGLSLLQHETLLCLQSQPGFKQVAQHNCLALSTDQMFVWTGRGPVYYFTSVHDKILSDLQLSRLQIDSWWNESSQRTQVWSWKWGILREQIKNCSETEWRCIAAFGL